MIAPWRSAWILAVATLQEALRTKILWVSLLFAIGLVAMSVAAASVSIYERSRLIIDVGLGAAGALAGAVALAASVSFFSAQLRTHTVYPVLARPLPRWSFVLGRFLGLWAAMIGVVAGMGGATLCMVILFEGSIPAAFAPALWLCCMQMGIVVAVGIFFSTLAVPALAASYGTGLLIAGSLSEEILHFAARQPPDVATAVRAVYYLIPDLSKLSLRAQAANSLPTDAFLVAAGSLYALTYSGALLCLAMLVFSRRQSL